MYLVVYRSIGVFGGVLYFSSSKTHAHPLFTRRGNEVFLPPFAMCISCHEKLSDSLIKQQLDAVLKRPQYQKWNECSVSHLLIIQTGCNGEENKLKAIKLLDGYRKYRLQNGLSVDFVVTDCSVRRNRHFPFLPALLSLVVVGILSLRLIAFTLKY
uniref:Transmembrane protein n=1 Tax=Dikerogammarus haemobaphes virus 1 TaxID=2704946 RepID=A0A6G9HDH2_9VIRU|nr:hypothetical protein [Dikerogammarus haemobaphes virus 1]